MSKIETLKNKSGESFYPLTSTKAVVDENGNTIEGRLVVADGEDLVTDGNVLRLKDRPNTDGMGYVILRKEKTFQDQVTKPNTIYEIRYDFDLNGAEVTIPENCVLKFEGGMLRGGTVVGDSTTINAPLTSIFSNDVSLAGSWVDSFYVEWFGASQNNSDNSGYLNNAIFQLSNMTGCHLLIFSGFYTIKDTVWLRQRVSLKGIAASDVYSTATPKQDKMGSGLIVDFDDKNKYAIDSMLLISGKDHRLPYNQMWVDLYEIDGYHWGGSRKDITISDLTIQQSGTNKDKPYFGGIRLLDVYYSKFKNIHISGAAVGMNVSFSWGCRFENISLNACLCGMYFGKWNTIQSVESLLVQANYHGGNFDWDTHSLIWKDKSKTFPQFDAKGLVPGEEGYTGPVTIKSAGIISENWTTDSNKIHVSSSIFQYIDAIALADFGYLNFDNCYYEGIAVCGLHTNEGNIEWKSPSFKGTAIGLYTLSSPNGLITAENMFSPHCCPYATQTVEGDEYHYKVTPLLEYLDRFVINEETRVVSEGVAAAKYIPEHTTYYVGTNGNPVYYYDYNYQDIASGLNYDAPTSFANIMTRHNPEQATIVLSRAGTDFSMGGTEIINKNLVIRRGTKNTNSLNYSLTTLHPIRLKNSSIDIKGLSILKSFSGYIDSTELCNVELNHIFEISGKCSLKIGSYFEPEGIIKLAGTEPIELEVTAEKYWKNGSTLFTNLDTNTKYRIKVTTARDSTILTNTGRPTAGLEMGDKYFDSSMQKFIWWTGTEWVEGDNLAAGIKRAGTWSQRPNADGSYLENGFQYFLLESEPDEDPDGNPIESITGNGKPIWWIQDGSKWVDATGATVTG